MISDRSHVPGGYDPVYLDDLLGDDARYHAVQELCNGILLIFDLT